MRQLHFDLLRLLEDDRQGSHGSRRARRYVLAQAAETLYRLGYWGLRAKGLKGRHIEALVAEWRQQGLSDGTVKNRMAHLRWLAKKIGKRGSCAGTTRATGSARALNRDLLPLRRRAGGDGSHATRRDRPTNPRDRVRPRSGPRAWQRSRDTRL